MYLSRRRFIKSSFFVSVLLSACRKKDHLVEGVNTYEKNDSILTETFSKKIRLTSTSTIVFIGDSITDGYRDRTATSANTGLGTGFVNAIVKDLFKKPTLSAIKTYNRGISGNVTNDIYKRLDTDLIDLNPSVVSILVGVNDLRKPYPAQDYYNSYKKVLQKIKQQLPAAQIILSEPFILPNIPAYIYFKDNFHEYRKVIRSLAKEFNTVFVPYFQAFDDEARATSNTTVLPDGLHPSAAGITLMESGWLAMLQQ
jgi:lysophospholipase L1-like esterase